MVFTKYEVGDYYDELVRPDGGARNGADLLVEKLEEMGVTEMHRREEMAKATLRNMGITFNWYTNDGMAEKIFPFDVIPRIIQAAEWQQIETGLLQRIQALNLFLTDLYGPQHILNDGTVPRFLIETSRNFLAECRGLVPPGGIWSHISGMDVVRDASGHLYVLEDNLRCPSGVSYVLGGRAVMKKAFPQVFNRTRVQPVEDYPARLLETLMSVAPEGVSEPNVVVLTPGSYNSAYFEHSFLAQQMGVELVEGRDLEVERGRVMMRTTQGLRPVDVVYRRIDDDFLDPHVFREDSVLGVPGIFDCWRRGTVTLVNAPGAGVADDKAVYGYVPKIIEYYLGQKPVLQNVPTSLCWDDAQRKYVLEHLAEMVVKPVAESGGYGITIGPKASKEELAQAAAKIEADPRNWIAQPTLSLSRVPTLVEGRLEGRHVDLRPFVLQGSGMSYVLPGGLTRVALRKGSLVVNSSQGGGSKDTWVLG